jgi:hypothetical protein
VGREDDNRYTTNAAAAYCYYIPHQQYDDDDTTNAAAAYCYYIPHQQYDDDDQFNRWGGRMTIDILIMLLLLTVLTYHINNMMMMILLMLLLLTVTTYHINNMMMMINLIGGEGGRQSIY